MIRIAEDGRPTRDYVMMKHAGVAAMRSTCSRLHVGAVVARDARVLVTGYNGVPTNMPHCEHDCTCHWAQLGNGIPNHDRSCPQNTPCTDAVHAEANAVAYAARHGVVLDGTELFSTHMPCFGCAQLIVNAGIMRVVFAIDYRSRHGVELLTLAGVEVEKL